MVYGFRYESMTFLVGEHGIRQTGRHNTGAVAERLYLYLQVEGREKEWGREK